jgi:hypothetical protein
LVAGSSPARGAAKEPKIAKRAIFSIK